MSVHSKGTDHTPDMAAGHETTRSSSGGVAVYGNRKEHSSADLGVRIGRATADG